MSRTDPIVIVSAARTPMGAFQGSLKDLTAPEIGAIALKAALDRAGLDAVDEVLMGNVLPAGIGQNPARQAALGAGLGKETPSTTISKVCGSGMKALMLGHDALLSGSASVLAVGGMESMTNAPYLLPKARGGFRLGHGEVKDHMFLDGLEDAYSGRLMGTYAEDTAEHYQFSRADQDGFALRSLERATRAAEDGSFAEEVVAVAGAGKRQTANLDRDEQPTKSDPSKIPKLKPAFRDGGSVTAANSSSISDGAAALILMRASEAEKRGLTPLAIVAGHAGHAQEPAWFTTAPIGAIDKLLARLAWEKGSVGLYEINEAFAVVAMAAIRDLGLSDEIVNINGGACALGHPIGASGARIIVTLLHAMRAKGVKRGIASLCIGGGEATAVGLELLQ
ncbi:MULTISPECIES: acetyl-CoA C-acyltransferase [Ensifer]|uniref:Acetyl-CoA C-acyltransferase n=1 Tax=Ensifer adhaerens TaxID=106592 RepID=A0ABY8HDB1_ENSAD|nr:MULTISPECIES: acetyl-CoA C-acyltransferase [Ensifer]ANK73979.1 acetyl-CoA acetyltransferase [Ensifer adhaerens]KDP76752.1 acetyl-CoA acetyltransferase [Ensifer adhaerens]KQX02595.1 acetyl-CoA acetyltransferase [Ensifer sp. Root423]KQZ39323.1 acetyl-CoA acetyltransferase [Ensifer sp. Root558]MBD9543117.1 acetyl-CoA C-acyltransferase [Ensifer sp. ENS04]